MTMLDDWIVPTFVALVAIPWLVGGIIILRRADHHCLTLSARPPVPDDEFLLTVRADEADAPLWLAIRGTVARVCGVSPSAIHPGDRMDDIWKCLPFGSDFFDHVFQLERALRIRIPRGTLEPFWERGENFGSFARAEVEVLRDICTQSRSETPPSDGS